MIDMNNLGIHSLKLLTVLVIIQAFLQVGSSQDIYSELNNLNTEEKKIIYLEELYTSDQSLRKGQTSKIIIEFGKDSNEYRNYINKMISNDSINLLKIEGFLRLYEYPSKHKLGNIASITPWTIIHHAQGYDARERNIPLLHKAYVEGNLDHNYFIVYLERMYKIKLKNIFLLSNSPVLGEAYTTTKGEPYKKYKFIKKSAELKNKIEEWLSN